MTDERPKPDDDDGFQASGWWGSVKLSAQSLRDLVAYAGPSLPWLILAVSGAILILAIFLGWSWVK